MKKMVLLLTAVMMAATLSAQPALRKGMESKHVAPDDLQAARYMGRIDKLDAWIMEGRKHVKQVVLTDVNMEPVSVSTIEDSKDMEVLAAGVDDIYAAVLLVHKSNKRTVLMRCLINTESHAIEKYDTVIAFDYGRKDVCMLWGATSPSGNHNAFVCVIQMNETNQYYTTTVMFDGRMERQWEKEFELGSMHEMLVTDDGLLVTLGEDRDEEQEQSHFIFNVMDSANAASYDAVVKCNPVAELHLGNVVDDCAIVAGTYRPTSGRDADKKIAGVLTMSFNVRTAAMPGLTMRPLQNEDMNIFLNTKTRKIQRDQECDHLEVMGLIPTSYGAVLAVGHNMRVEKTTNGGSVKHEGYGVGVNLTAVDTSGHVRWVRNLRRNDMLEGEGLPTLGLAALDDMMCVVKSEHAKTPAIYDISDDARRFVQGDKGNVVIYTIADDGTTQKLLLETKSKQTVVRMMPDGDKRLLIFSKQGKKTRLAELTWK